MTMLKMTWTKLSLIAVIMAGITSFMEARHFLWSVTGTEGSGYIMGSIHLLKKEYFPLPDAIRNAFAECGALAVEADISADKVAEAALIQMQKGMYDEDDSLKNHVSTETWQLAERKLSELGMDIKGFARFKPWMLALTIVSMEMMRMGFDPRWGVDRYFLETAPDDMEILELEGLESQMELFNGFSDAMSERFLFFNIQESENARKQVEDMVSAWFTGDIDAMESLLTRSIQEHPELTGLYEVIVYQRNQSMTERILELFSPQRKLFVVVGAAHLVGEKGIIARLRGQGYRVRQL
ncbi:MAG: TraB/GumN family protein [Candidatus Aminicenantes bacterium]|nr:TraB/GumN family protein [Candidatus Aminicenantes bacterium]